MGNSLRCCLACVLPCGALDLIRIVHINGHVEEYSRPVMAKEVLQANPNHVISKPCSQGVSRRIMIVSSDAELKRGSIYFLIPASALPQKKKKKIIHNSNDHHRAMEQDGGAIVLQEKKTSHHRRKSSHVSVWRPHLESIIEDQL